MRLAKRKALTVLAAARVDPARLRPVLWRLTDDELRQVESIYKIGLDDPALAPIRARRDPAPTASEIAELPGFADRYETGLRKLNER